jgi:hypothetical protein
MIKELELLRRERTKAGAERALKKCSLASIDALKKRCAFINCSYFEN